MIRTISWHSDFTRESPRIRTASFWKTQLISSLLLILYQCNVRLSETFEHYKFEYICQSRTIVFYLVYKGQLFKTIYIFNYRGRGLCGNFQRTFFGKIVVEHLYVIKFELKHECELYILLTMSWF